MLAALRATRRRQPAAVVVAVPVGASDTIARLREEADDVVCLHTPFTMGGVGQFYRDFTQVDDATVSTLLKKSAGRNNQAEGVHDLRGG